MVKDMEKIDLTVYVNAIRMMVTVMYEAMPDEAKAHGADGKPLSGLDVFNLCIEQMKEHIGEETGVHVKETEEN